MHKKLLKQFGRDLDYLKVHNHGAYEAYERELAALVRRANMTGEQKERLTR